MDPDMCQQGTVCAVSDAANHDPQSSSPNTRLRLRQDPAAGECRRGRALGGASAAPYRQPPRLLGLRHARTWIGPTQATPLPVRACPGPAGRAGVRQAPCQLQRCSKVKVEKVPWADGKRPVTKAFAWMLAGWAQRLSRREGKTTSPPCSEEVRDGFHWNCMPAYTTTDGDYGRIATRSVRVSDELDPAVPDVTFPGVRLIAQVRLEVAYKKTGKQRQPETVYLVTSLGPEQVTPQQLLQLKRSHWGIENRVHYVRDVAVGEDKCSIRKGSPPRLMAAVSNLAISILRLLETKNIQRRMSQLSLDPNGAAVLLLS